MARDILIADSNKAAHKAFEDIFKETDYRLIFSENGEDALQKMKMGNPALVIADVTMPNKNGKELCQLLKGDPNLNRVPFILLGGPFDDDIEEDRKQVKADGAITKPLKREPILRLVDGLLTAETSEAAKEAEGEILELEPMKEVIDTLSPQGEEEVIELVDLIEEPAPRGEVPPAAPGEFVRSEELRAAEEEGIFGDKFLADLQLPEEVEFPRAEEEVSVPEVDIGPGAEVPGTEEVRGEPAEMKGGAPAGEEMSEVEDLFKEKPAPEPQRAGLGSEEETEELSLEGMGESPQEVAKEKVLTGPLAEALDELPEEGASEHEGEELGVEEKTDELSLEGMDELLQEFAEKEAVKEPPAGGVEELPLEGFAEPEGGLGAGEKAEEPPVEGMGELPEDVLKERRLEEALAEEIEELPGDFVSPKGRKEIPGELEGIPDEGGIDLEGLEEAREEVEGLKEEKGALEQALRELPGEALEEGEGGVEELPEESVSLEELGGLEDLGEKPEGKRKERGALEEVLREFPEEAFEGGEGEEFPDESLSLEGLEGQPREDYEEIDLEGLAQKVLKEEDLGVLDEEEPTGEVPGEFHEEVFKEGELEKWAEEATREGEGEEFPEGALAEAIEEFTGETLRRGEEVSDQPSRERPIQDEISGAIKELVEGVSAKILPQLTKAIADIAAQRIEKTVQKIVPELAEQAIKKEIQKLEKLKTGEDFDI